MYSIGVPRDSILKYESAVKANKFLVLAHGTADEVARAREILHSAGAMEVDVHGASPATSAAG